MTRALLAVGAALAALCAAAPAQAERYALTYRGAVFGLLPLGEATLDIDTDSQGYRVRASLRSSALMSLFERTRLSAAAEGRIEGGAVRWARYELDHHYARKHRAILMSPIEGDVAATITPNYRVWGEPPTSGAQKTISRDPLSSLVAMAADVGRTRTCAGAYPTFDGRFHYVLELGGGRTEAFDEGGYQGQALRCRMRYIAVAGYEPRDGGRRGRIPEGEIWFALPEGADIAPPVRVTAPLPFGRAGLTLTQWRAPTVEIAAAAEQRP